MEFIWAIVEYASCLCEPLFACILFSHHLGCKNKRRFAALIGIGGQLIGIGGQPSCIFIPAMV